ncbi:6-hydroxymethylpterin diphosphokinase MptE-like protein [Propionivibrio soli]|uniref:6-hydroxymethylpterin diphosphokinase MptE-like protein n=1 Tax=Propionivibrio soli TaxID=2976531 RepID=UPI0021E844A7|nr:6-hydroxymethylpterin diphosphokinase MptE-like protein [Propionivibrio soli]
MSKFDLKEKLDKSIYRAYNVFSTIMYVLDYKSRRLIRKNVAFKDIHKGGRCFILGTGPSLSLLSPEEQKKLKTEVLFGVNSYHKADIASVLVPTYYALLDERYRQDLSRVFAEVVERFADAPPTFIADYRAAGIVKNLGLSRPQGYIYAKRYPTDKIIDDISRNIYVTMNVVSNCILVAAYMGFKEIYLLGCDYNAFCGAGGLGHCYDDKKDPDAIPYNLAFFLKYYWITTEFHYLIAQFAKRKGIKIVNLTPTSLLDAYPRAPLSSVL